MFLFPIIVKNRQLQIITIFQNSLEKRKWEIQHSEEQELRNSRKIVKLTTDNSNNLDVIIIPFYGIQSH